MIANGSAYAAQRMTFSASPTGVRLARAFVRDTLRQWGLDRHTDTAELIVSELATNAVKTVCRYANLIQVRIIVADYLYIGVWDGDLKPPTLVRPGVTAESGRGIFIVDCLAKEWGYYRTPFGKVVYAQLDIGRVSARAVGSDVPLLLRILTRLRQLPPVDAACV